MAAPPRSKANKPDTTQAFKSAMGAAVRAVAGKPELEVTFSADRPLLTSDKARLANLPRLPTRRDIAIARGQGDAMAMRLASHDPDVHRRRSPAEPEARAAFDALEQARVEALGCIRMPGMAGNIHEMLDDRLFRSNLAEVNNKDDAPLAEALGLILREKLAGVAIPPSGNAIVDLWKKEIEQKAGISGAHVWALSEVAARPGVAISDLARAMHVHQSTASNLVRMLMAAGLVSSERAGEDRRVVQLAVTPRGRKVLAKTPPPLTGLLPDALGRPDDSTLARMERDLGSLIAQLGADPREGALLIGLGESRQAREAATPKRVPAAKRAPAAKTQRKRAA